MSPIRQHYVNISRCGMAFLIAICLISLSQVVVAQYAIPNYVPASTSATTPDVPATSYAYPVTAVPQVTTGNPNSVSYDNSYGGMSTVPSFNAAQNTTQNVMPNTPQFVSPQAGNVQQGQMPQPGQTLYASNSQFYTPNTQPQPTTPMPMATVPVMAPQNTDIMAGAPNVPVFNPSAGFNSAGINAQAPANTPSMAVPMFNVPSQEEIERPKLAMTGSVGNAYGGTGQSGGAVPAFRPLAQETSPLSQELNVPKRERPDDRRFADQQHIDTWREIKYRKDPEVWRLRMPPYTGPLGNRTIGKDEEESSVFKHVNYFDFKVKQDDYEYEWEKGTTHMFDFSLLDPMRFGEQVKRWVGMGQDEGKARKHMENALELMKQEKYEKAAKEFEWAAYYWPETTVEEDARYHAAECYYRIGRYYDATKHYTMLLSNFQSSQYKAEVIRNMFGIAKIWIEQVTEKNARFVNVTDKSRPTFDTFGYAEKALKTIVINCPNDPLADDCIYMLACAYMRRGKVQGDACFEHAAEYFKQLQDDFPNSEYVIDAMRLEVVCRQRASLGAAYATRQIDQAGEVADRLLGDFGTALGSENRNEVLEIRNGITEEKAASVWVIGKHYDDRKDYGAARLQYQRIIADYPTTQYAEKARKRLEEIRDYPDELPSDWERIKAALRFGK